MIEVLCVLVICSLVTAIFMVKVVVPFLPDWEV